METGTQVDLGEVERSRVGTMRRVSSVLIDGSVYVGCVDGSVRCFERDGTEEWCSEDGEGNVVSLADFGHLVVAGERGKDGWIRAFDKENGELVWSYSTSQDIGDETRDHRLFYPYVVDIEASRDYVYAVARRYEKTRERRRWETVVYSFYEDGEVRWTHGSNSSAIAMDLDNENDRLGVAFNRMATEDGEVMGDNHGLVVIDSESGESIYNWDPGTEGDRRVGDISIDGDRVAVSSHGDYHGYVLDAENGAEIWRTDLGTEVEEEGEILYSYPNHVYMNGSVAFITGNSYSEGSTHPEYSHPNENSVLTYLRDGTESWSSKLGGYTRTYSADDEKFIIPSTQNLRDGNRNSHSLSVFDIKDGEIWTKETEGVVTGADIQDGFYGAVEEPMKYSDEDETRGSYVLHMGEI